MIALALFLVLAFDGLARFTPTFDIVEINHKLNEDGSVQFTQVIVWDWAPDYCAMHCQGWSMVEQWRGSEYGLLFSNNGITWDEVGGKVRETWTTYDPEVENRQLFPTKYRRWKKQQ